MASELLEFEDEEDPVEQEEEDSYTFEDNHSSTFGEIILEPKVRVIFDLALQSKFVKVVSEKEKQKLCKQFW